MKKENRELSLEEYKKTITRILKYLDDICKKENISYSLFAGSLIGAVREGGIIPWDDDIDIILDPKNLEKLKRILTKNSNTRYKLLTNDTEETYYYPHAKMVDTKTEVEEIGCKQIKGYGAYIDVFCFHNAPDTKLSRIIHFYKIQAYKAIFSGYAHKVVDKKSKFAHVKKIGKKYAEHTGIRKIINHYNKMISKYDNRPSKYVICDWPALSWKKDYQLSSDIKKFKYCKFENIQASIYKNYDRILTTTFGDYMTPPDKEKRISKHSMKAIIKE